MNFMDGYSGVYEHIRKWGYRGPFLVSRATTTWLIAPFVGSVG